MITDTKTHLTELTELLTDPTADKSTRMLRLQGWRGDDLACGLDAGKAGRIGSGSCAVLAAAVAVTGSVPLAVVIAIGAVIGAFAPNHPIEMAYNAFARRSGRTPLPANRAGKRLGCAMGSLVFAAGGSAGTVATPARVR